MTIKDSKEIHENDLTRSLKDIDNSINDKLIN